MLIFHSPQDETVDIHHARRLYEAAKHPKSFVRLDGADHLVTDAADAQYIGEVLGACTSMTMRMYADREGWPLDTVEVRLRHNRIHPDDCEHCEDSGDGRRIDVIDKEITVDGPGLTDEQRQKLLHIASRCPVNRILLSNIDMHGRLEGEAPTNG